MVEHPGGRSLRFPVCVGIDVHGSSYIGVPQKFLHILRCCAVGQQIGCESMSKQMEVKLSQIRHHLSCPAADTAYRCGGFKGAVLSYTDHGQFLIPLRHFLGSRQTVHLVVDPVLFPYFLVVVMFTPKDERFKDKGFLHNLKEIYTDLINRHISDPTQHLRVFDPNGVYLATKKIGKNNPMAAEIEADNAARQEWNRTADMALLSGIAEETIIELKNEEIHNKAADSVAKHGWLPELFRKIVRTAKELLQGMIREKAMPPKPVLNMDIAEFRKMQKLMIKVQNKAKHIRQMQETDLPRLKAQLADVKGIFKGKERKALEQEIQKLEQTIREELDALPTILEEDGYPDVQAFTATYRKAEKIVSQYNRDLAQWERTVQEKKHPVEKPPEKQSVRDQLRRLQEEGRKKTRNRNRDYER